MHVSTMPLPPHDVVTGLHPTPYACHCQIPPDATSLTASAIPLCFRAMEQHLTLQRFAEHALLSPRVTGVSNTTSLGCLCPERRHATGHIWSAHASDVIGLGNQQYQPRLSSSLNVPQAPRIH